MKIFRIDEYLSQVNESGDRMDFGDVYAPKSEIELVNFIHDEYHDAFNRKADFGFDDIKHYKIDLSRIRDKSILTKTLMRHETLTLDDIEFLYILGITENEVKNDIITAMDIDFATETNDTEMYPSIFVDTCIDAEHYVTILGVVEWGYETDYGYPEDPNFSICHYGSDEGTMTGVQYMVGDEQITLDTDLLKKFPIYDARLSIESRFMPSVYDSGKYAGNDWLSRSYMGEMEKHIE